MERVEGVESQVTLTVCCGFIVKEKEEEQGRVSWRSRGDRQPSSIYSSKARSSDDEEFHV